MTICYVGWNPPANGFMVVLDHHVRFFKYRIATLQLRWEQRNRERDFDYTAYRTDYLECNRLLQGINESWSMALALYIVVHLAIVIMKIFQFWILIKWNSNLTNKDIILVLGLVVVYSTRLLLVLYWIVKINTQADALTHFVRRTLSMSTCGTLNLDTLVNLIENEPVSVSPLGVRPDMNMVYGLIASIIGGLASGFLPKLLDWVSKPQA